MINKLSFVRNLALGLISALFLSCENPTDLAFDVINASPLQTYYVDTVAANNATFLLDSASTSFQSQILIGGFNDFLTGYSKSDAYLQPTLPDDGQGNVDTLNVLSIAIIDSVQMRLTTSQYHIGDSLSKITFSVHRLIENLNPSKNYAYYDKVAYDATPLTEVSFNLDDISNAKRDTLLILKARLPVSIGEELMQLNNTEKGYSNTEFVKYFKGFALVAKNNPKGMYGFTTGLGQSSLTFYYHVPNDNTVRSFYLSFNGQRFSSITTDRSATKLAQLKNSGDVVLASKVENYTYAQMGTGVTTKIDMSGISKIPVNSLINSAVVELEADTTIFSKNLGPFSYVLLGRLDSNNKLIYDSANLPQYVKLNATSTPVVGQYDVTTKKYVINIAPFVQDVVNQTKENYGLAVLPASVSSAGVPSATNPALNRLAFKSIHLKIYYSKK